MLVKIENERNLVRDIESKAVINTDASAYNKYIEQKRRNANLKKEAEVSKTQVAEMRSEIDELKKTVNSLIELLVNKENHGNE